MANNKLSVFTSSQLPQFVRTDHPQFVKFMEAYYRYTEQYSATLNEGKVQERLSNLLNYFDADETHTDLKEKLYTQFMESIPDNVIVDKTLLLKNVLDFYRSNGSERSIRFLINILTGSSNTHITYPKDNILRASDGKWYIQQALRITDIRIDGVSNTNLTGLQKFENTLLRGNTSNSSAIVEKVSTYYETGIQINEVSLTNIEREFQNGEQVYSTFTENGQTKTISANVYSGIINTITITDGGSSYNIGDPVTFESNTGNGAIAVVSSVSAGGLSSIGVLNGGAGFQTGYFLLITGSGSGGNAEITQVDTTELYHPNSYTIFSTLLLSEANTPLANTIYSNLNTAIVSSPNANTYMANAIHTYLYANTGPISVITINNEGTGYVTTPSFDARANGLIKSLGILGRMAINNAGSGYAVGELIYFVNQPGEYGFKGLANVRNVNGSGGITQVGFVPEDGYITGGYGYRQNALPSTTIVSNTGVGANITVTAILGDGETFTSTNTSVGQILAIDILNRGTGYQTAPTLNLRSYGDGTAQAVATIVTGVLSYPGRYLNEDGMPSSSMRLQDRDYYQNFSYVIHSDQTRDRYRKTVAELAHPAGLIMHSEYDQSYSETMPTSNTEYEGMIIFFPGQFTANDANTLLIYSQWAPANLTPNGSNVILEFVPTSNVPNVSNGYYYFSGNVANLPNNMTYSGNLNIGYIDA